MRHIIPISGKDSLATAIFQTARQPDIEYEYVYNPTGLELPEVNEWLKKVEEYLGKEIIRVGSPLLPIIEGYNYFLPNQQARYCTRESKIEPFIEWIGGEECTVYYGIRADEKRIGFDNSKDRNITPVYPLAEAGIDINGVYILLNSKGLKPPTFFWEELFLKVCRILDKTPEELRSLIPEWVFDVLFAWRSRANCYWCFNQRKYEWIGLLIFHPNLFWKGAEIEELGSEGFSRIPKDCGTIELFGREYVIDPNKGMYTWNGNGVPLKDLAKKKDYYIQQRANQVAKAILKLIEVGLFDDPARGEIVDTLQTTSCGLFCGK